MPEKYPRDWKTWTDLSEAERRFAIADPEFWDKLDDGQKQLFLDQGDWQEIRLVPAAKQAKLDGLISLDEICQHLGLNQTQIWFLMSTRKLPGALVGGTWRFDRKAVDRWVVTMGGIDATRRDVEAQIAKHRSAREAH